MSNDVSHFSDDELEDAVRRITREQKRRAPVKPPSQMSDSELARWQAAEIAAAERAKAEDAE